jgi:hypothetical protein
MLTPSLLITAKPGNNNLIIIATNIDLIYALFSHSSIDISALTPDHRIFRSAIGI